MDQPLPSSGSEVATVVGPWKDQSNRQSCAEPAAAAAETGVAGDVTEGKCSVVVEMQQRG